MATPMSAQLHDTPAVEPVSTGHDTTPIRKEVARVLEWGFRVSAALLGIGLLLAALQDAPLGGKAVSFSDIIPDLLDGKATAIVSLAILAMMATPVVAVLTVAQGFRRLGDRRYALASFIVLLVLAASIASSLLR
jgi:uncharacterized membrane protein